MTSPNWDKPPGCHCYTLRERDRCYEACEPAHWADYDLIYGKERKRANTGIAAFVVAVLTALYFLFSSPAHSADYTPPRYCAMFKMLERTCTAARLVVKMYGKEEAERRARACGASDNDIAQAQICLTQHGE